MAQRARQAKQQASRPSGATGLRDVAWPQVIGLLLLATLPYLPAMHGEFLWDDHDIYITNNPLLRQAGGWYRCWVTTDTPDYYPLTYSTFWIEWQLWQDQTLGYHVVNLALHVLCVFLLWQILQKLNFPAPWLVAALFAVHPVNVETVAWISQRKSLLATAGAFASFACYLQFETSRQKRWYVAAVAMFVLSVAGKPTMITLPAVMLGYAWYRRGTITRADVWHTAAFWAVALLFGLVGLWFAEVQVKAGEDVRNQNFLGRLATAGWVVWFYLGKDLVPYPLTFVYPRWDVDIRTWLAWVPDIALAGVFLLSWKFRNGWGRHVLAGLGYFVLTLLPVVGFLDAYYWRYSYVADHYQYQSLPGVLALCVAAVWYACQRWETSTAALKRAGAALVLGLLVWLTWHQASLYQTQEGIWRDSIAKNPHAMLAQNNLGLLLRDTGRLEQAQAHYLAARQLLPDSYEIHQNLGTVYVLRGQPNLAIESFEQALKLHPRDTEILNNLGSVLLDMGRTAEAEQRLRDSLNIESNQSKAHSLLGALYYRQGERSAARAEFELALESERRNPLAPTYIS